MKISLIISIIGISTLLAIASCEKNTFKITERTNPEGKALVKIGLFNAYLNSLPTRVTINGETVSNELLQPVAYPGGGLNVNGSLNSDYLQAVPGGTKFEFFAMVQGSPIPISKLFETTQTIEPNKRYTLYITDTAQNTSAVLSNDDTETPDSGFVRVKFVNIIPNLPALDMYKGANANTATLLLGNIAYKGTSAYVNIAPGTDSFFVRPAGSAITTVPVARRGFTFSNQRIYTILARGYNGAASGSLRAANVSAIINQ